MTSTRATDLGPAPADDFLARLARGVSVATEFLLFLVVLAGVVARAANVPFYVTDSGDEWGNTIAPLRVLYQWGDPGTFFHPSLYYYVTAAVYAVLFALFKVFGGAGSGVSVSDLFLMHERYFILAARTVSVVSAALATGALYALGKSLWQRRDGLAAAALLAVLPLHALYSKTVRVDSLFLLLLICALSAIVQILKDPEPRTYAYAGVLTGLAIGTNYNAGVLVLWLAGAHFLRRRAESAAAVERWSEPGMRQLGRTLLLVAVGFLVSSPFVVLNTKGFLQNFSFISGLSVSEHPGWAERGVLFYAEGLAHTNPQLGVLIAVSSLAIVFLGNRTERFVLSLPVGYLLIFSLMRAKDERFILPAMALFLLVCGGLPSVLARRLRARRIALVLSYAFSYALLFLCIGTMAPQSLRISPREHGMLARPDGALFEWIEGHVPPHSAILVESGIVPLIDTLKEPGRFAAALRRSLVAVHPNLDQRFIGPVYIGGRTYDPAVVVNKEIDYAAISPRNVQYIEAHCDIFPEVCAFYTELRAKARLVFQTPEGVEPVLVYETLRE